jgi:Uma2 family endonuclease
MSDFQTVPETNWNDDYHVNAAVRQDLYEIVDGQAVGQEPMGAYQAWIASFLNTDLDVFARRSGAGRVVTETLFRLSDTSPRRPDVAYVSYDRWPQLRRVPDTDAWNVVPNLAVEVVGRTNLFEAVVGKVSEYFRAGVERVWLIAPSEQCVHLNRSATLIQIVTAGTHLHDEELLPGFSVKLDDLFDVRASDDV